MHPFYDSVRLLLQSNDTWWLGLISMLLYLIFWAVVCLAAYRILRQHLPALRAGQAQDRSVQILRERFARGEISVEQYREMLAVLDKSRPS
ncbi:MAG: hypothetical protein EOM08_03920 [Clostridia bacterium]|nr:hypothetical protein [Clostridia bacterium]